MDQVQEKKLREVPPLKNKVINLTPDNEKYQKQSHKLQADVATSFFYLRKSIIG